MAPRAAATVNCASSGSSVTNYTTGAPVSVTVAAGCSLITYTVVGGDGAGSFAGRGATLTGTINIANMNVPQTLYVIAGGGGTMVNEEVSGNGTGVAAGGKGYGNGGDALAATTGSWHGGGGAGSAILLASATPAADGSNVTPLVVAGGGGGSAGFQFLGNGSGVLTALVQGSGAGGTGAATAGVYSAGTTGITSTATWDDDGSGSHVAYDLTVPSGTGASGVTGGAAGAVPTVSPDPGTGNWYTAVGVAGQTHGLGAYGGGNGGNGPTPLTGLAMGNPKGMNPGGGGGGGWAGGGGGTSGLVKSTPSTLWCTLGAGGGGGTSYAVTTSVPNVVVSNGALTVVNSSATPRADTRASSFPWANNGSVTITWS